MEADEENEAGNPDLYYIVTDKCTECVGFHDEPQCAAVCPVDCWWTTRTPSGKTCLRKAFLHL